MNSNENLKAVQLALREINEVYFDLLLVSDLDNARRLNGAMERLAPIEAELRGIDKVNVYLELQIAQANRAASTAHETK